MTNAMIPFAGGQLPAYMKDAEGRKALAEINREVAVGAQFPTLSIKGKVFAIVKDNEKTVLRKPDEPDELLQSINLAVLRANTKARVYYAKGYVEGESDGQRPTCFSNDGVAPSAGVVEAQAKKCQICKHAEWVKRVGDDGAVREGTDCAPHNRLAVADPDKLGVPMLLRVPTGSRKNFNDAVKAGDSRGIPYNAMVLKVSFDHTVASPKLIFKPVGLLSDAAYSQAKELYGDELVLDITGLSTRREALPAPETPVDAPELDAAIAAKAAPAPAPAPAPEPARRTLKATPSARPLSAAPAAPAPAVEAETAAPAPVAPAPAKQPAADDLSNLLGDLDALLGSSDD